MLRWLLPPAHTLDGSAAKISMQDFLMIYKEECLKHRKTPSDIIIYIVIIKLIYYLFN